MSKKQKHTNGSVPRSRKRVDINPITPTQEDYIKSIDKNDITFGVGSAGTGKTYLATLMAMEYQTEGLVDRIVICRPAINAGGEKIGFLPGTLTQKMDPYTRPIFDAFRTYWQPQTIQDYIGRGTIEICPLAYMRGRTFAHTFIVADEMQNATPDQMLMLLTRLGEGSKMVITGDPVQSDVNGRSCFHVASDILGPVDTINFVEFSDSDVVRHPTVKKVLDAWSAYQPQGAEAIYAVA